MLSLILSKIKAKSDECKAFTLVELLVVITIISLLVSILLPVMGSTREATEMVKCQSNQRQIMTAFVSELQNWNYVIPYTRNWGFIPITGDPETGYLRIQQFIRKALPHVDVIATQQYDADGSNFCPSTSRENPKMIYPFGYFGYAVNTWWANDGEIHNELHSWDDIRAPAQYPFFFDPEVYPITINKFAASRVPSGSASDTIQFWGIGKPHGGGHATNVAYADGSVRTEKLQPIIDTFAYPNSFDWLQAE